MAELASILSTYVSETRKLAEEPSATEATFYPSIKDLIATVLEVRGLPFDIRTSTSEASGMPDFVVGDKAAIVGVFGEVKRETIALNTLALSDDRNDQVGRYLSETGAVLISNIRGFGLVVCTEGYSRKLGEAVPPSKRRLLKSIDLWSSAGPGSERPRVDPVSIELFADIIETAVTDYARIADPADLAKILARQARFAKEELPDDLKPVAALLDDYKQALGLAFDVADDKGDRFFRSSLIQTVFYSLFAAWILWDQKSKELEIFTMENAEEYLPIPFLRALLHDIRHPDRMRHLGLAPHLARAVSTLNRVDRKLFRSRMNFPTINEQTEIAAITYFYEPFLEAFDPQLREELGVWYTPPEIVRYQVRRVHHLLKVELKRQRGLADPEVYVLDPCCGTGAYLLEVARCIADELKSEGDASAIGLELLKAFHSRVVGFEILTAPFAIAQLQLYLFLKSLNANPTEGGRLAVFLTNALSGWNDSGDVKLNFPEMREEYNASQAVKQGSRIIVILGNPPYDAFAGVAQAEEAELVAHYKGIELTTEVDKKTKQTKLDDFGRPKKKQKGESALYSEFGIRKQLLDDLYIRFFRLAEERIGEKAEYGIVSYISNSSYLTGRSHPIMRRSLLMNFDKAWIDNLNGDKFRTGKLIPKGLAGEGRSDQSVFTTDMDPRGIQPGTAISTWIKRSSRKSTSGLAGVSYRDFWGMAAAKRASLIASLPAGDVSAKSNTDPYITINPSPGNRWRLSPHTQDAGYESWPGVDQLFPVNFQGIQPSRGLEGSVLDTDRDTLVGRIRGYFAEKSFAQAAKKFPVLAKDHARFSAEKAWTNLRKEGHIFEELVLPLLTFPFDQRQLYYVTEHKWLNEARKEFGENLSENEFLAAVFAPRKASEVYPLYSKTLINYHLHERGSYVFPRESGNADLFADRDANLEEAAWRTLRSHFGFAGDRRNEDARKLVGNLFRLAFAVMHAPAYQMEHASALSADWAHLPIPKDKQLFDEIVRTGEKVVRLLDADCDASETVEQILGRDRSATLGATRRIDGEQLTAEDLKVTVTYWGGGKGRWKPRDYLDEEKPDETFAASWGRRTGDLFINDSAFFSNVPEEVWTYQLGGYPVLKKWLGYRQGDRRDEKPLNNDERQWLREIVRRIAALLALHPQLNALYQQASANCFSATELGISENAARERRDAKKTKKSSAVTNTPAMRRPRKSGD